MLRTAFESPLLLRERARVREYYFTALKPLWILFVPRKHESPLSGDGF